LVTRNSFNGGDKKHPGDGLTIQPASGEAIERRYCFIFQSQIYKSGFHAGLHANGMPEIKRHKETNRC
jgi:hypothetical protein